MVLQTVGGLALGALLMAGNGAVPVRGTAEGREVIGDPRFRLGFRLQAPEPGRVVFVGDLTPPGQLDEPVWRLAQWSSRHSLEGVPPELSEPGVMRLRNPGKGIVTAAIDHPFGEITMDLYATAEYDRPRARGEKWPHLLVAQRFQDPPVVSKLTRAHFHIEARLLQSESGHTEDDCDRNLHAAQFQVFFNVQNLNRDSAGYGDFLYFGIPLYDTRHRVPRGFEQPDWMSKFIYTPDGSVFTDRSMHDAGWVVVDRDILPLILEGLGKAWERGFLQDSKDLDDYRISAMNMGWEVPGIFDVSVQVRNLSLIGTQLP